MAVSVTLPDSSMQTTQPIGLYAASRSSAIAEPLSIPDFFSDPVFLDSEVDISIVTPLPLNEFPIESEWTRAKERQFDRLAAKIALSEASREEIYNFHRLQNERFEKLLPQKGVEFVRAKKADRMLREMLSIAKEYVQVIKLS